MGSDKEGQEMIHERTIPVVCAWRFRRLLPFGFCGNSLRTYAQSQVRNTIWKVLSGD